MKIFARDCYIFEGEPLVLVARVETLLGVPLTTGDVTSFSVEVFLKGQSQYALGAIPPEGGWSDTLIYGYDNLLGDSKGANFLYNIEESDFPFQGGNTYRVQVIASVGGSKKVLLYNVIVGEVL